METRLRVKLREARIKAGLSPKEIAKKLRIRRASYVNIELGKRNPSFELAIKICQILNKKFEDIFLPDDVSECHIDTDHQSIAADG